MKKNKTFGLLLTELDGNYESIYWNSFKNAANQFGCNLVVYEGRELDCIYTSRRQHNMIYSLISRNRLDGILVSSGALIEYVGYEKLVAYLNQFNDIPVISIGQVIYGTPSIILDDRQCMRKIVEHVVKDHRYKRIAFLKGPNLNAEANERFQAYIEVLNENNIEIDNSIIFDGNFQVDSGYKTMREKIKHNINFDTLVCANDEMALGVIKAAKELNLKIPEDFKICGIDDTLNGQILSLTTVRQPLKEIAEKAVEMLINKIDNIQVNDIETFQGTLIRRTSCGCLCENDVSPSSSTVNSRIMMRYKIHENIQTYSLDELFEQITIALNEFGIRSCFIAKYPESLIYTENSFVLPEKSNLIYAYYNKQQIEINDYQQYFDTLDIVPDEFIPKDRNFIYLLTPLFFKNEHFGYVVFEVENADVVCYELLRGQISNTFKGAVMIMEREKMKEKLSERERLASLGHLIGGISHNLNTPIMSISGVLIGFEDLIKELRESVGDSSVTKEDHEEIAQEMSTWLIKLNGYVNHISNTISEVRIQSSRLNANTNNKFSIKELLGGINLLIKSNLIIKSIILNLNVGIDTGTTLNGEMANLAQVINNLIINAFQSYDGLECTRRTIDLNILQDKNDIMFIIRDYGAGIPDELKSRIFNQMVTSKGKNGTGLSLLLSYSTILGKFNGKMWFETTLNQGTAFYISIPIGEG